jgi:predicted RNase H-like HicB family nuclease
MRDYHIDIFPSDLPHCSAFGETPEEALAEMLSAREAWLAQVIHHIVVDFPPRYG